MQKLEREEEGDGRLSWSGACGKEEGQAASIDDRDRATMRWGEAGGERRRVRCNLSAMSG